MHKNMRRLVPADQAACSTGIAATLVTGSLSPLSGGMFYSARIPANKLVEQGFRVDVHGLIDAEWSAANGHWHVSSIAAHQVIGPQRIGFSPDMLLSVRHDADLVHLRGLWAFPSFVASRLRRSGKPLIVSPEGMLHPWALQRSAAKKRMAAWLFEAGNLHGAAVIHALNQSEAEDIRSYGYAGPIAVIPNGVDLEMLHHLPKIPTERKTLLFLGRVHPKKGLAELIASWAAVVREDPDLQRAWRIDIAGWDDGNHRKTLERQIAEAGVEADIQFLGVLHGDAKEEALSNASGFILPSFGEGLPISVLEAWAYRLPVLMTAECNLREGFVEGAASELHLDQRFAGELAAWLRRSPEALREMGARGRKLVEKRFDWADLATDFADLYRWVVGRGERPSFVRLD
ncbi:glycosyltransferase [Phenylobacterium sp.]|uniref:glycosyltransferase n=1 Tax=Phenylobacterium sp. TaxID=1871053 RepID=UPI00271A412D|nr:glycosyltransferase [Phenylobacterium sp.]MDO8801627.1 glycosyltransferase [Phenylobacterium sp.]